MKSPDRMFPRIAYMAIASFLFSTLVACQQSDSGKKFGANQSSETSESRPSDVVFELGVPRSVQEELADEELNEDEAKKVKNDIVAKLGKIGGDAVNVHCKDNGAKKRTFGFLYLSLDEVGPEESGWEPGGDSGIKDVPQDELELIESKKKFKPKHKKFKFGGHNGRRFIPLHCTSNLSIELKGLTKGATYQLTAQFYSLSKKVKYEGVATFSYPEETKIDLVMTPVKDGTVNVNVIFDEEGKDDEGTGTLIVNFKGNIGKKVGLVVMSTVKKCGVHKFYIENQCGAKELWKTAVYTCQNNERFDEESVLCREADYFKKLSETNCLNRCITFTWQDVVSTKQSATVKGLEPGEYVVKIRNNIEIDDNIDKTTVLIKDGEKASVDLKL